MRRSEWIAFSYFAFLAIASWLRPLPLARRLRVTAIGVAALAGIRAIAHAGPIVFADLVVLRDWAPLAYLLGGYYVSGLLFVAPSARIEAWMMRWDRRLLGDPTTRFHAWPRTLLAYLEIVYMGCFLLPPAGFAVLVAAGHSGWADRYWTIVTGAELGSFGPLAFIQTRPPWVLERRASLPDGAVHRLADRMVRTVTIGVNTFPSGHVAGSLAVALGVWPAAPAAGAVFLAIAASIAAACVVGRYHYVVDVVAGVLLVTVLLPLI